MPRSSLHQLGPVLTEAVSLWRETSPMFTMATVKMEGGVGRMFLDPTLRLLLKAPCLPPNCFQVWDELALPSSALMCPICLSANNLVCYCFMDVGRGHESSGSVTKGFTNHGRAGGMSIIQTCFIVLCFIVLHRYCFFKAMKYLLFKGYTFFWT